MTQFSIYSSYYAVKAIKNHPLVTVATLSDNQGCFIEETILSVKNQTYPHIEHIIIDETFLYHLIRATYQNWVSD